MLRVIRKAKEKSEVKSKSDAYLQDKWSAEDFVKGLKSYKTEIGSMLFTGSDHECKLIKRLCSYFGVDLKSKAEILCGYPDCSNKFYVTHYTVEY